MFVAVARIMATLVVMALSLPLVFGGNDWLTSWGTPHASPLLQHSLCIESKSYFVNSTELSKGCPAKTCRFDEWKEKHYLDAKFAQNDRYSLRRIPVKNQKQYMYVPTRNVENHHLRSSVLLPKKGEVHPRKVVVSILNADFGNQLYQASFGQMVAEQHDAAFYVRFMDEEYRTEKDSGESKPRELEGFDAIRKHLDPIFLWELLPADHPDRETCSKGNVTFTKRVYDIKHPEQTADQFHLNLMDFAPQDSAYGCLVILGFYKNLYPCAATTSKMWASLESDVEGGHHAADDKSTKFSTIFSTYKYMASHQREHKLHTAPIKYQRTKPKPKPKPKRVDAFHKEPAPGHIIGDTSYERDNNPDLLLKRLRHRSIEKKQGRKSNLFLDGRDIT